ncbi:hypothetical protein BDW02DRAFT_612028 [Decorospora gaudefroyi]|uniref:C3H1-type domain-containing protein n=1 Tax=Decorospora gaudefroyi TaxID=184978 RepID=A0A6A5JX65_9PLEO|nr:hypothetical protein BDW02DRAFT_612028 [Decorospora gaudefroyi]
MPPKRGRPRPNTGNRQKGKRNKAEREVPAIKEEEPTLPKAVGANSTVDNTKKAEIPVAPINPMPQNLIAKQEDTDNILWDDDRVPGTEDGAHAPVCAATPPEYEIDIYTEEPIFSSGSSVEKVKAVETNGDEDLFDTKPINSTSAVAEEKKDEKGTSGEIVEKKKAEEQQPAEKSPATWGKDVIFKLIEWNLSNTENLASWITSGAVGSTETRQIGAAGIKLEVTITLLEPEPETPVTEENNQVLEEQETNAGTDREETILPTTETSQPQINVKATAAPRKLSDYGALSSPATFPSAQPAANTANKPTKRCYFGDKCIRRDTCPYNHEEAVAVKAKMCTFVNTSVGCNKGASCMYSHDHEGIICKSSRWRSNCSNTHKCAFKHEDDKTSNFASTRQQQTRYTSSGRESSIAVDMAQKAALNRPSREASVAVTPLSHVPTGSKTGVVQQAGQKRGRGNDNEDEGHDARRVRNNYQTPENVNWQQQHLDFGLQQGQLSMGYSGNQQQGRGRGYNRGYGRSGGRGYSNGSGRGNIRPNSNPK